MKTVGCRRGRFAVLLLGGEGLLIPFLGAAVASAAVDPDAILNLTAGQEHQGPPLEIEKVDSSEREVVFWLRNHSAKGTEFAVGAKHFPIAGKAMHEFSVPIESEAPFSAAAAPVHGDRAEFRGWISDAFEGTRSDHPPETDKPTTRILPKTKMPFSFRYGGRPSVELLVTWPLERSSRKLDEERTEYVLTYADRKSGLVVRCVAVAYHRFPTVEWTLYFKNAGAADTPILENIQALNIELEREPNGEFLLHHNVGSPANGSDYGSLETLLGRGVSKRLGAAGGRPTNGDWSYFNLEAAGEGVLIVVGWPGQWAAELARDQTRGVHIRVGQELTHHKLRLMWFRWCCW